MSSLFSLHLLKIVYVHETILRSSRYPKGAGVVVGARIGKISGATFVISLKERSPSWKYPVLVSDLMMELESEGGGCVLYRSVIIGFLKTNPIVWFGLIYWISHPTSSTLCNIWDGVRWSHAKNLGTAVYSFVGDGSRIHGLKFVPTGMANGVTAGSRTHQTL